MLNMSHILNTCNTSDIFNISNICNTANVFIYI